MRISNIEDPRAPKIAPRHGGQAMATLGRCANFDYCNAATARRDIEVPIGAPFVCPECGKPLKAPPASQISPASPFRTMLLIVLALALVGPGGWAIFQWLTTHPSSAGKPAIPVVAALPAKPLPAQPSARPAILPLVAPVETIRLKLRGSNTIGAALGPRLAASFLASTGDTDVAILPDTQPNETRIVATHGDHREAITVSAHGSATAFLGLAKGDTDIGMSSRRVKPEEAANLKGLGDMTSPANEHVLALDGIAVIVNQANPVAALTKAQLQAVFSGSVQDWGQLGGTPGTIHIFARDDKSGTFDTFKSLVLDKTKLAPSAKRVEDSRELSSNVAADPLAIGFIGLPYVLSAKAVAVGEPGALPLLPNRLTVATEDYPLARRLFLYTPAASSDPMVARFVSFALSPQGQAVVEQAGFIPLTIKTETADVPQEAPGRFRSLVGGAQRLSTNFRFQPNSADLDNRALLDLDRLVEFVVSSHATSSHLILVGFADSQGSAKGSYAVSKKRADVVSTALLQRGVRVGKVAAFGADLPVADNATPDGREKNRRVEAYLAP